MLSPDKQKRVERLLDRFWTAGLTNPLITIEQITYLLLIQRLEDLDGRRVGRGLRSLYQDHEDCRWSAIRVRKDPKHLAQTVFPWLRGLEGRLQGEADGELLSLDRRMDDASFQLDHLKRDVLTDVIALIDELFDRDDGRPENQDVMGDIFEHLLSEIASSGNDGHFSTPRHILRFVVELLDPQPGARVIDPAAGTAGFLFCVQQHMLCARTDPARLRLEWDGTAHNYDGGLATEREREMMHDGRNFVGIDKDRTMARIGWMNLILHGVENPRIVQGDSLSRRGSSANLEELLASEAYDFVLANPPFAGTVDMSEFDPNLFPSNSRGNAVITAKSELLFVWLMLDLLKVGGRCAVIVPEGVLTNGADVYRRLRQELLTEHEVEAVISLPGGVFLPYTSVKTSVLVFRKQTGRDQKKRLLAGETPRTREVWFYEVKRDGRSMDAKRTAQPYGPNDLWDALEKFKARRGGQSVADAVYLQPEVRTERWRVVDVSTLDLFPKLKDAGWGPGVVAAVHELFPELVSAAGGTLPEELDTGLRAIMRPRVEHLVMANRGSLDWLLFSTPLSLTASIGDILQDEPRRMFTEDVEAAWKRAQHAEAPATSTVDFDIEKEARSIAVEYAKLHGFTVDVRSRKTKPLPAPHDEIRQWVVPVRAWRYENGKPVEGELDPDCIEALGWNLSAGQFRPLDFSTFHSPGNFEHLVRELVTTEKDIVQRLERLLTFVEKEVK